MAAYLTDIEIAQACEMRPIMEIAKKAHIDEKYIEQYGRYKAKVDPALLKETDRPDGRLVLVTAITPTPAGEGKTTTTIGLADGLKRIGKDPDEVKIAEKKPKKKAAASKATAKATPKKTSKAKPKKKA